ncbi:MAG TPA: DUF4173 domain-containing protein [Gemmatimonadaceae bacterium]|nr:DUF4173 domain-containing protein [Gemmatimonadaceae bacterium]
MNDTVPIIVTADEGILAAPAAEPAHPRRRIASRALVGALILGILGDALLRTKELGINFPLWVLAAAIVVVWLSPARPEGRRRALPFLIVPLLFFASAFAWRDAEGVLLLNMAAMLVAFGVIAFQLSGWPVSLREGKLAEYFLGAASLGISAAIGAPLLALSDGALAEQRERPRRGVMLAVGRGLLIALPLVVVFGALLSAADARFEQLVNSLIAIDVVQAMQHVVFAAFVAWVAAGYLRAGVVAEAPLGVEGPVRALPRLKLGIVEIAVPLALVDLLFLTFVVLQLPYLFGGAAHVQTAPGLTVAEYARRGFFELLAVAVLVLPLLIGAAAVVREERPRDARTFRWLGGAMLALVAVMMLSALQRMRLYAAAFGLTEDRIYATAIMGWLALVFVLFAATVLRGRSAGFVFGAIVCGWLTVAVLDIVNPQAIVVRTNVERAANGATFDDRYVASLGADAAPELAAAIPRLGDGARCTILRGMERTAKDRGRGLPEDWRWWNASRSRAYRIARSATANGALSACPAVTPTP